MRRLNHWRPNCRVRWSGHTYIIQHVFVCWSRVEHTVFSEIDRVSKVRNNWSDLSNSTTHCRYCQHAWSRHCGICELPVLCWCILVPSGTKIRWSCCTRAFCICWLLWLIASYTLQAFSVDTRGSVLCRPFTPVSMFSVKLLGHYFVLDSPWHVWWEILVALAANFACTLVALMCTDPCYVFEVRRCSHARWQEVVVC